MHLQWRHHLYRLAHMETHLALHKFFVKYYLLQTNHEKTDCETINRLQARDMGKHIAMGLILNNM